MISKLDNEIVAVNAQLQDLSSGTHGRFDIVVLYNVIDHLDEDVGTRLHRGRASGVVYSTITQFLMHLTLRGGVLVIADCGRVNLWNALGVKDPLALEHRVVEAQGA